MHVELFAAPWYEPILTEEVYEAVDILGSGVWSEASERFYREREAKLEAHERAPKGMQQTINKVLVERFHDAGWVGEAGYFHKGGTWLRVTFRHQMSLGSDFLDAIKVCKKERMDLAMILAADAKTLRLISPNDANAIVSFEKVQKETLSLCGAIDIPLVVGRLTPATSASFEVERGLRKERLRDVAVPSLR